MKRNYHMDLVKQPDGSWKCGYCEETVDLDASRSTDCSHAYPVCKTCGGCEESNECKPDCAACWEALSQPDVYIAGHPPGSEEN
jgi:hypothetical protein